MTEIQPKLVVVTGANGFLGRHLLDHLRRDNRFAAVPIGRSEFANPDRLAALLRNCDYVMHCAGVNRGEPALVESGNIDLAARLIAALDLGSARPALLLYITSTQERLDNHYGRGKRRAGELLTTWGQKRGVAARSYMIPNVFGDGGRPFYNSVVATFCHQLARGEEPRIVEDRRVPFIYVHRVIPRLVDAMLSPALPPASVEIKPQTEILISELLALLRRFHTAVTEKGAVPAFGSDFELELYHTFRAYLGAAALEWKPQPRSDARGTLFEVIKQEGSGQVFFSTTKPGIIRGNHYHTRKIEKFCVVQGDAVIRMRRIGTNTVLEFPVSGRAPAAVEMPILFAHHIENVGPTELVTLFWSNEVFDPTDPDTFMEEVTPPSPTLTAPHQEAGITPSPK